MTNWHKEAFADGFAAGSGGADINDNPWIHGTFEYDSWEEGWIKGFNGRSRQ